jgi:hypothetical protein
MDAGGEVNDIEAVFRVDGNRWNAVESGLFQKRQKSIEAGAPLSRQIDGSMPLPLCIFGRHRLNCFLAVANSSFSVL